MAFDLDFGTLLVHLVTIEVKFDGPDHRSKFKITWQLVPIWMQST